MGEAATDVLIMGGGLAGLSLAIQLRQRDRGIRVVVIERRTHPVREAAFKVGESTVEIGAHPAHVVADRQGRAFVSLSGSDEVAVVDLAQGTVATRIRTGAYPHGLRLSPDGAELYVANVEDGSVSVVDTASLTEAARIPVGAGPVQVGFTPDGSRVYVSLRDENRVAVIDTATREVTGRIEGLCRKVFWGAGGAHPLDMTIPRAPQRPEMRERHLQVSALCGSCVLSQSRRSSPRQSETL